MASATAKALRSAYDDGFKEGVQVGYKEVLNLLEQQYMTEGHERGSVEANAILEVVRKVATKMRERKNLIK